jgi:hypothetical protein
MYGMGWLALAPGPGMDVRTDSDGFKGEDDRLRSMIPANEGRRGRGLAASG